MRDVVGRMMDHLISPDVAGTMRVIHSFIHSFMQNMPGGYCASACAVCRLGTQTSVAAHVASRHNMPCARMTPPRAPLLLLCHTQGSRPWHLVFRRCSPCSPAQLADAECRHRRSMTCCSCSSIECAASMTFVLQCCRASCLLLLRCHTVRAA